MKKIAFILSFMAFSVVCPAVSFGNPIDAVLRIKTTCTTPRPTDPWTALTLPTITYIHGDLYEADSNQGITGAEITVCEDRYVTDSNGEFTLFLPGHRFCIVTVNLAGYEPAGPFYVEIIEDCHCETDGQYSTCNCCTGIYLDEQFTFKPLPSPFTNPEPSISGDLESVISVLKIIVNSDPLVGSTTDTDGNGIIDLKDAILLLQKAAGLR